MQAEIKAAKAKKKQCTVDVAEQREKARLRAQKFLKNRKREMNDKKKKEVDNKLLKK